MLCIEIPASIVIAFTYRLEATQMSFYALDDCTSKIGQIRH